MTASRSAPAASSGGALASVMPPMAQAAAVDFVFARKNRSTGIGGACGLVGDG
jgi:hypothetical protein